MSLMERAAAPTMAERRRTAPAWLWPAVGLAATFFGSFMIGRYPVAPHAVLGILAAKIVPLTPFWPPEAETVVLNIRLPRILAAMMVGAALSGSGAAFQGVFRNPLASPDILGVSAGAGFGAALALLLGLNEAAVQMSAFLFGLAAVFATHGIASWRGGQGDAVLVTVLAGIIITTVFTAGISLAKYVADPANTLPAIVFWLMGSLASVGFADLGPAAAPMGLGLAVLIALRWRLNVLSFGDEEARALGVDAARTRLAVVVAATLVTAAAVAVSGIVALVGLVVPHLARLMVGPNHRPLLPACIMLGAASLLTVDDLARGMAAGEVPLGILTSLIGAPFFLCLVLNSRKGWG